MIFKIGIVSLEVPAIKNQAILLINNHDDRTTTGFTYYLTLNNTNKVINLRVNYICVDDIKLPSLILRRITANITDSLYVDKCKIYSI